MSLLVLHQRTRPRDPTRTLALRRRFAAGLRRRLREGLRLIRQALLERDVFGRQPVTQQAELPADRAFAQSPPDRQVNQFMAWVRTALAATVLTPSRWWHRLVRQGYEAGWRRGQRETRIPVPVPAGLPQALRPQTPAWQQHADLMAERLTQLTASAAVAVRDAVSRTITGAVSSMVEAVTQAFTPLLRRADTLAETSIVAAHATGTLDALEQGGIRQVTPAVEYVRFTTAGDARVCQRCRELEGRIYPIAEARGVIPVHGRCRCTWLPVRGRQAA